MLPSRIKQEASVSSRKIIDSQKATVIDLQHLFEQPKNV